jgi:hypothetical protein
MPSVLIFCAKLLVGRAISLRFEALSDVSEAACDNVTSTLRGEDRASGDVGGHVNTLRRPAVAAIQQRVGGAHAGGMWRALNSDCARQCRVVRAAGQQYSEARKLTAAGETGSG